jgi:RimJ/RimL family protein N-acetyltransferase
MGAEPDLIAPMIAAPLGEVATRRLDLKRFTPDDMDALAPVFAKVDVWRYPYGRGFGPDETAAFVAGQVRHWDRLGLWVAVERSTGRTVGYAGLSVPTFLPEILPAVEVGWRLDPDVWGLGYATEAAQEALDQAFGVLGLSQVCSLPQADNPRSVRVAERLTMNLERPVTIPANEERGAVEALLFTIDCVRPN